MEVITDVRKYPNEFTRKNEQIKSDFKYKLQTKGNFKGDVIQNGNVNNMTYTKHISSSLSPLLSSLSYVLTHITHLLTYIVSVLQWSVLRIYSYGTDTFDIISLTERDEEERGDILKMEIPIADVKKT